MKKLIIAIAIAFPLAFGSVQTAVASKPATTSFKKNKQSECAKARKQGKTCRLTFDTGDDIEGGNPSPGGEDVYAMMNAVFGNLITLRWDFIDQIVASADDFPL